MKLDPKLWRLTIHLSKLYQFYEHHTINCNSLTGHVRRSRHRQLRSTCAANLHGWVHGRFHIRHFPTLPLLCQWRSGLLYTRGRTKGQLCRYVKFCVYVLNGSVPKALVVKGGFQWRFSNTVSKGTKSTAQRLLCDNRTSQSYKYASNNETLLHVFGTLLHSYVYDG